MSAYRTRCQEFAARGFTAPPVSKSEFNQQETDMKLKTLITLIADGLALVALFAMVYFVTAISFALWGA